MEWGSSAAMKKNYRQIRNYFWNLENPLIQSLIQDDIL
jgi:hypothetical protein